MICDISKYQGAIDWDKLAPQLEFCVLKASSGKGKDPTYDYNAAECGRRGVPFHAYHFVYAVTEAAARQEARIFADAVAETSPLFYVIDAEYSAIKATKARGIMEAFEDALRETLGQDIRVALYIGHHLYKSWALDYGRYAYVWIPRYGKNTGTVEGSTKPDFPCDLWQYTSNGTLPGVPGRVDLNALNGDKPLGFFIDKTSATNKTGGGESKMLTSAQLVEFCKAVYAAGWVYWYGTYGRPCTEKLYESKKAQYPEHYTPSRASGYKKDIAAGKWCADCVGMIKAFFWTGGQFGAPPVYKSNNCPDKNANGMFALCEETGKIGTLPDEPGLVVWKDGHIGVYIGNGDTIEMRGFDHDCVKRKVSAGPWKKWGRLPASMLQYAGAPAPIPTPPPSGDAPDLSRLGSRTLKKGRSGTDVKQLQAALIWLGYDLGRYGSDGDFGSATERAVRAFQKDRGLQVDGQFGPKSLAALRTALKGATASAAGTASGKVDGNIEYGTEPAAPEPVEGKVEITGGSVNVRNAPGTVGTKVLGVVRQGDKLTQQGLTVAVDGRDWYQVLYQNQSAWVSSLYAKPV